MIIDEIEELRERLNRMVISKEYTYDTILKLSQELDCLIVKYIKNNL